MKVIEEFLNVVSLKGRAIGKNIKEDAIKCMKDYQLDLKNLIGIVTDGPPSMTGKNSGAATLIRKNMEALKECPSSGRKMFICHCFLQLENLCAQVLNKCLVMIVVVKTFCAIK